MIEDVVTVYYGEEDAKLRNLQKTEIMPPELPQQGDVVSVDDKPYTVKRRMFDADSGEISVLAVKEKRMIHPDAAKKAAKP